LARSQFSGISFFVLYARNRTGIREKDQRHLFFPGRSVLEIIYIAIVCQSLCFVNEIANPKKSLTSQILFLIFALLYKVLFINDNFLGDSYDTKSGSAGNLNH
jgi:hypothetical protein